MEFRDLLEILVILCFIAGWVKLGFDIDRDETSRERDKRKQGNWGDRK